MRLSLLALILAVLLSPLTSLGTPHAELVQIENEILLRVNQVRQENGLQPVEADPRLTAAAHFHSQEMLQAKILAHNVGGPACTTLRGRLRHEGVYALTFGENLFRSDGNSRESVGSLAMESWMNSPTHRHNLLNRDFNRVGVGIARQGDDYFFTQVFSRETLEITEIRLNPVSAGFEGWARGRVLVGATAGAVFFDHKRIADWEANDTGHFEVKFQLPGPGLIEVGQVVARRRWEIETEIHVQEILEHQNSEHRESH